MQRQLQVNITLQIYTKNINMNLDEESGGDNQYALPFPSLGLVSKKWGLEPSSLREAYAYEHLYKYTDTHSAIFTSIAPWQKQYHHQTIFTR